MAVGALVSFHVPVRVDGAGKVKIGNGNHFGYRLAPRQGNGEILLQARTGKAMIEIGQGNWFSNNVTVVACIEISIGKNCLIGDGVTIFDADFHGLSKETRRAGGAVAPVHIRDDVWIGSKAMVLKGVTVGSGAVVAPMSVVTKDVPDNCVVAGIPAKVIRYLD